MHMDAIFSKLWVQLPGSMAAGPGSSKKWHGILQKKQLGDAGRGGAAWGGHATWCWGGLPHGSNMFKQGWGWKKIFFVEFWELFRMLQYLQCVCLEDTGIIVILLNSNSFLNDVQIRFCLVVIGRE
jgi:hypothetical protein